ncbi:helix-turn-helix domain-containing protein [Aliivibrio fischeri]
MEHAQMTPFEVAVRIHLAKGVSLRWLLLDEGEPYENSSRTHTSKVARI